MNDWLLDLGNTRLKLARLAPEGPMDMRSATHGSAVALLDAHLLRAGDRAWLASVAPAAITDGIADALAERGVHVQRARSQASAGRLRVAYADPSRLGVDRFLALLAASEREDGPWVTVSAGTALTADVLDADGQHFGGVIVPNGETMRAGLAARFPVLDLPAGEARDLGADTGDAIAAGLRHARLGAIARVVDVARKRFNTEPTVLLSGGEAGEFEALELPRAVAAPALVLDGLAVLARGGAA